MKVLTFAASCLILVGVGAPAQAKGALFPKYHPKPCAGEACRGDDARSGVPCAGLLCSFSSAKALQRPVTASETAQMPARAVAAAPAAETAPAADLPRKKRKTAAKHPKADKGQATVDAKLDADRVR